MIGQNADNTNWSSRLTAELKRDKKKTAMLATLLIVAGIFGGRLLVSNRGPRAGRAVEHIAADSSGAAQPGSLRAGPAEGNRDGGAEREAYLSNMDREITRDLFKPGLEYFPPQGAAGGAMVVSVDEDEPAGMFGQIDRWISLKQQAQQDRQSRMAVIDAQAQALLLESTMLGTAPTAIINGRVLRKGEWISGFCVERIDSNACVVSKDGVEVELHMKR